MKKSWEKNIGNVVDSIRNATGNCVFLIGAGCSKSAGIPLASELIREISTKFPHSYAQAPEPDNYNSVMSKLTPQERKKLINDHIEKAKINWAHLALAQLFHTQKINRVLTTNFDPLVVRACAMTGHIPAIYDLATTNTFKDNRIAPRSIFHLNGQHTGFTTLNTSEELKEHEVRLREIVKNTNKEGPIWVVIGYSGAADPLLEVLTEVESFEGGMYWVDYDSTPSADIEAKLLNKPRKTVYYLGGHDADNFLTELAQKLDCFPPALLVQPFSHITNMIEHIDFETGKEPGKLLKTQLTKQLNLASEAQSKLVTKFNPLSSLLAGKNQEIIDWYTSLSTPTDEDKHYTAWAWTKMGDALDEEAQAFANTDLP
ncbi:MAG: hypothetical protein K2P84_00825, partial [Undibacterium sp.]|nr:hypothetical protein [Undibacterium sp.]